MNRQSIEILKMRLNSAEAIVIGAGAGLSAAAGFRYDGERFGRYFSDFEAKYGFHDMYSGGFYPYKTPEEFWAYWSRYIYVNRYLSTASQVYQNLFRIVANKDYFVITTNVDHCFQRSGFEKSRLFYTQGDYGLFQCSVPCHHKTYDNAEVIKNMFLQQKDMHVPHELVPTCPICGAPMVPNLRCDDKFVEDDGWRAACKNYTDFLSRTKNKNVLFWELGVGFNTPGIIKYPFWQMTAERKNAFYACVNRDCYIPQNIAKKSVAIEEDISAVLEMLMQ